MSDKTPHISVDRNDRLYWQKRWQEQQERSFLKQTQTAAPERWAEFYDRTAPLWGRITGMGPETAQALADEILSQGLAGPGTGSETGSGTGSGLPVLELGCGPGHLSLALAQRGIRVTALDLSSGMLRTLRARAARAGLAMETWHCDWKTIPLEPCHSLVAAACLPEAFSPSGIRRMEHLAGHACLLVMGRGREVFPLRRLIWDRLMDQPCQVNGFHLECAENWLRAAGRKPRVTKVSLPLVLDADYQDTLAFYTAYFGMFRHGPGEDRVVARAVRAALDPFESQGRVKAKGMADLAMIAWPKPAERPGS